MQRPLLTLLVWPSSRIPQHSQGHGSYGLWLSVNGDLIEQTKAVRCSPFSSFSLTVVRANETNGTKPQQPPTVQASTVQPYTDVAFRYRYFCLHSTLRGFFLSAIITPAEVINVVHLIQNLYYLTQYKCATFFMDRREQ